MRRGKCETCGTFNLLGVACSFPAHPNFTCRGCGRPLTEAYPTADLYSEMERIHLNGLRAGRFGGIVGAVAGVLLLVAVYQAAGGVQNLPGGPLVVVPAMFFVVAAYAAGRWIVIRVLRGLAARSGLRKGDILVGLHQWETVSTDNVMYVLNHPDLATFSPLPFFIIRQGQVRRGAIQLTN